MLAWSLYAAGAVTLFTFWLIFRELLEAHGKIARLEVALRNHRAISRLRSHRIRARVRVVERTLHQLFASSPALRHVVSRYVASQKSRLP